MFDKHWRYSTTLVQTLIQISAGSSFTTWTTGEMSFAPQDVEAVDQCSARTQTANKPDRSPIIAWVFVAASKNFFQILPCCGLLNKNSRKDELQTFDRLLDDESKALKLLEAKLMEPQGLAPQTSQGSYTVDIDACYKQIGCVLLQKQPDRTDRPILCWSCWLDDAEKNMTGRTGMFTCCMDNATGLILPQGMEINRPYWSRLPEVDLKLMGFAWESGAGPA